MASPLLETVSWAFSLFFTVFALIALTRGIAHLVRQLRVGQPDHTRTRPVLARIWGVVSAVFTHREFKGRPLVKVAHWVVMVSFPVLFLTLVTGYVHLRDQLWSLPLFGHFFLWEWLVEFFAWAGFLGIIALMIVRRRSGHGSVDEASLSNEDDSASPSPPQAAHPAPRDGSPRGIASRFLGSTRWQALFVEWVVLIVCAAVIALRALDYMLTVYVSAGAALTTDPTGAVEEFAGTSGTQWWHYPLTAWFAYPLAHAFSQVAQPILTVANTIVVVSTIKIITSMLWMMVVGVHTSMGVAWHRFLAVVNLYARRNPDGTKSLGPAAPMLVDGNPVTDIDALDDDATLGVGTIEDFTWKARLDFYSCTECGRCQELCPAWNTRKPLSPKLLVLSLRDHMQSVSSLELEEREVSDAEIPGDRGIADLDEDERLIEKGSEPSPHSFDVLSALSASGATGERGVADTFSPLVPDVIDEGVLWDCTMCGACVDQCPVDIEHIDHIIDLRRHQVLMESAFPRELGKAFRAMEKKANPYNQPARKRLEWAKDLPFDVPVIGEDIEDAQEVDYLFWVGCAGAYDDKAKATTAAVAELLHTAGVSFAVLGSAESCTGDPARRAGNEVLFQLLASAAIETLQEARVQKIVVTCAHCFNTIAGEFPQLGGRFDVVHHTQLLNRLVRDGLLTPLPPSSSEEGRSVTYHDPCFLGRHNRVYEAPRNLISSLGVDMVEMPRNSERAMCCGAGGARAWMEETRGIRIADARMAEAASTGAEVVATACPFCSQMLGSATGASVGFAPRDEDAAALPEVKDVALMLLEGVRRGQDTSD